MSLYTPEVKRFIFTRNWPKGLIVDIKEYTEPAPYLQFIFYRDNFEQFDGERKQQIANTIQEVMMKLRRDGIPCFLEKKEYVGE